VKNERVKNEEKKRKMMENKKKLPEHSKTAMAMSYLCRIKKQRTKHRSAMQQGVNANAPRCALGRSKNAKYKI
jgi:hypothetical protein